jgi:hypothetical protein
MPQWPQEAHPVENIDILVNGQKVFQGDATFISRDIQFLG